MILYNRNRRKKQSIWICSNHHWNDWTFESDLNLNFQTHPGLFGAFSASFGPFVSKSVLKRMMTFHHQIIHLFVHLCDVCWIVILYCFDFDCNSDCVDCIVVDSSWN